MKLHKSGLIGLVLGVALLGACEDKTDIVIPPPPDPPIELNLVPDQVTIAVGETAQLVAVVSGGPAGTVRTATFTSSNNNVATVSAAGVVTGVAPGTAQITARATADNNAADVTNVTVTAGPVAPTVSIKSITQGNTNTPVQINNVQGQIDITANLEAEPGAQISEVIWFIDDVAVCRRTFTSASADVAVASAEEAQAAVELVCSVNTAAFDTTTGAVTFRNGPHEVSVQVIGPQGTVIAEAPPTQFSMLVFNNQNFISVAAAGERTAADAGGLLWHGGALTVRVLPVLFSGPFLTSVGVTVADTAAGGTGGHVVSRSASVSAEGPVEIVFPTTGTNSVAGIEDDLTTIVVNTIQSGAQGPAFADTIRYDVVAPTITTQPVLTMPWIGANFAFTQANLGLVAADTGVNVVQIRVQTAPTGTTTFTTRANPTEIGETQPNALDMRLQVCDALENCVNSSVIGPFGVDLRPPALNVVAALDSINPTTPLTLSITDTAATGSTAGVSGPGVIQVSMSRTNATNTRCVDPNTGAETAVPAAGCAFVTLMGTSLTVPPVPGPEAYFDIDVRATDIAGNVSALVEDLVLVDNTAPTAAVTGLNFTTTSVTVSGTVTDNLDLRGYDVRLQFAGSNAPTRLLPFSAETEVGSFGLPLTTSAAATGTAPVIRGISGTIGAAGDQLSHAGFGAIDVANNFDFGGFGFAATPTNGVSAGNAADSTDFASFSVAANPDILCRSGTTAACTSADVGKTSSVLTATAFTGLQRSAPFTAVYFYYIHPNGYSVLIGSSTAPSLVAGTQREFRFTATLQVSTLPTSTIGTMLDVFAVGVDDEGDALISSTIQIQVK